MDLSPPLSMESCYNKSVSKTRESGGTGRRARLRIWSRKGWGFESPLSHQPFLSITCGQDRDVSCTGLFVLGCGWLRTCCRIKPVDETNISPRNQMDVLVRRNLDRTVSHLIPNVGKRCSFFDQQASKGVP